MFNLKEKIRHDLNPSYEGQEWLRVSIAGHCLWSQEKLAEAVDRGELVQVGRGLYALPGYGRDLTSASTGSRRGVFSDDTALFLHGMTDRAPFSLTMAFPRDYNATRQKAGIICRTCADRLLELGLVGVTTQHGNIVRAYDLENTFCDLVRGQGTVDSQIVIPAMRAYVKSPRV